MKIREIRFTADPETTSGTAKALDVVLPWAPAVVMFGPNDAGKSNVLEAIELLFYRPALAFAPPEAPARVGSDEWVDAVVVVELEDLDDDRSTDARLLAQMLQFSPPRISFYGSYFDPAIEVRENDIHMFAEREVSFTLGSDEQPLSVLRARLSARLVREIANDCREWQAAACYAENVVGECLKSPLLLLHAVREGFDFSLLLPIPGDLSPRGRGSLQLLAGMRHLWPQGEVPLIDHVISAGARADAGEGTMRSLRERGVLLEFGWLDLSDFAPYDVVRISDTAASIDHLIELVTDRLRLFVNDLTDDIAGYVDEDGSPVQFGYSYADPWLEPVGEMWRVHPVIKGMCEWLSTKATEIAPRFVREIYAIHLVPTSGAGVDGQDRLLITVSPHKHEERSFDIRETSSGVAIWVGYSIAEAIRRLEQEVDSFGLSMQKYGFDEAARRMLGDAFEWARAEYDYDEPHLDEELLAAATRSMDDVVVLHRRTLYVFDEPERHLHSLAQDEVAQWMVDLTWHEGADVLVATHAPAFLDLPSELVEYVLVNRDRMSWKTKTTVLSADLIGKLNSLADDAGINRSVVMQLVRAFLIVEGHNDRRVIEYFFYDELRRARIMVVPLHGTRNTKLLAEAEALRSLDRLMLILFDNTADQDSSESKAIKQLLEHWPETATPPLTVPFECPDMIRTFPDPAMRAALAARYGATWAGWADIDDAYSAFPNDGWKKHLKARLPNGANDDELVDAILRATPPSDAPAPLTRAINEVLALVESSRGQGGPRDS